MDTLKEKIKYYREKKKVSKSKLAQEIGVSPSYITRLENGEKSNPSLEILMKIAKALDVQVTYLDPNIPIWDIFDVENDVEKLGKEVREIENLNKKHQKRLEEVNEKIKTESKIEGILESKIVADLENEYNEILKKQHDLVDKLYNVADILKLFNTNEKEIIIELTNMYNSIVYDKKYDVTKLDDEYYEKLKQNIRNSIKEVFEEYENK